MLDRMTCNMFQHSNFTSSSHLVQLCLSIIFMQINKHQFWAEVWLRCYGIECDVLHMYARTLIQLFFITSRKFFKLYFWAQSLTEVGRFCWPKHIQVSTLCMIYGKYQWECRQEFHHICLLSRIAVRLSQIVVIIHGHYPWSLSMVQDICSVLSRRDAHITLTFSNTID